MANTVPTLTSGSHVIRLEHLTKRFAGGKVAVDDLTLEVPAGEICVLVGPSGCGKTTTMKMVNRLIEPTSGRIFLDGDDVTHVDPVQLRRRIGYVIQQVGLFPHQTIADNVATVPRLLGWDKQRIRARVTELLDLVGLDPAEFAGRYPNELSGGQRQRSAWPGPWPPTPRAADGRAVRRHRPDHPRPAPGRVPAPAGRAAQDRRVRHPRHRGGGAHGRPHRHPAPGWRARAVRHARPGAGPSRVAVRGQLRRAPTAG